MAGGVVNAVVVMSRGTTPDTGNSTRTTTTMDVTNSTVDVCGVGGGGDGGGGMPPPLYGTGKLSCVEFSCDVCGDGGRGGGRGRGMPLPL